MGIGSILIIACVAVFFLFITYQQARLFINRYLRLYNSEIFDYLKSRGYKLVEIRYPNNLDWKGSPFKRPPNLKVSLLIITINGLIIRWNKKEYKLIVAGKKNGTEKVFWVEIETQYFSKPEITIKEGRLVKGKMKKAQIIKIGNNCPACNFKIDIHDKICPDCGLYFE